MKIIHYRDKCIGCNSCVEHSSKDWKLNPIDGKVDLIDGKKTREGIFAKEIRDDEVGGNKQVAKDCPVNIIKAV